MQLRHNVPIFTFGLIDNDFLTTKLSMQITFPAVSEVLVDTYSAILICIHKGLNGDMSPQPDVGGPWRGQVNPCNAEVQITRMKRFLKTM